MTNFLLSSTSRRLLAGLLLFFCSFASLAAQEVLEDRNFIRIDQFGYMPGASKVAVIAMAKTGYNKDFGIRVDPGAPVEVVDQSTGNVVYSAYPELWNGGSVDVLSGDRGAWFDFSSVTAEGTYRLRLRKLDGTTAESYEFRIAEDVYYEVMRAAVNVFYYQRFNQEKTAEHASGAPWTDGAWFDRPDQEYAVKQLDNPSNVRDLHGGWFDAGDPNKYVTFAVDAVHNLLTTYDNAPDFWNDFDLRIPESGNNVPDLLDEIKFEIDWIKRMQEYDPSANEGGIIQKMGILEDVAYVSPPSTDTRARWYNGVCPSASITGSGMLAHAALTFRDAGVFTDEIAELTDRAVKAWNHYENSPNKAQLCDDGRIEAGDADGPGNQYAVEHRALATTAAVYLFALTGESKYDDFVQANFREARPWKAGDWGVYRANQGEALMAYTRNPNADAATRDAILAKKTENAKSEGGNYVISERENLYRARPFYFNWGSNSLISRQVADIMDLPLYDLKPDNAAAYTERAQSVINYLHGTNPSGICMLSNMYQYGAELSVDEMWHSWFNFGSVYDNIDGDNVGPAPGFITGGPNPQGQGNMPIKLGTHLFSGARVAGQPDQKAFSVDNFWQNGPWAYNEPAIYYQAAYVKALSYFVAGNATAGGSAGNGIAAYNGCEDAETGFAVANDTGANGTVAMDANSPGSAGGASVALFDAGDAADFTFEITQRRNYDVAVRVRVGEASGDATNLADQYTLTLDGEELEYTLDPTSVSAVNGDTYWGEIVIVDKTLTPGNHTLRVAANTNWLKFDRVCWRDANSVPAPPTGGGGNQISFECAELEDGFEILNEAGANGAIRGDNFTPGASGDRYINMFDVGDRVGFNFSVTEAGRHELRLRVRVGERAGTDRNLADKYTVTLDGEEVATSLDTETISELFDDTYWGDIVVSTDALSTGSHRMTVTAENDWLKFDRFCSGNSETVGLFGPAATRPASIRVSPNPSRGNVLVALQLEAPVRNVTANLYDLTGTRVASQPFTLNGGLEHQLSLDVTERNLPVGIYLLRLTDGEVGVGAAQRIVIQH